MAGGGVAEWPGLSCIDLRIAALFFENLELLHSEDIFVTASSGTRFRTSP